MSQTPNRKNAAFDRDIEDRLAALVEINAKLSRDAAARAQYEEELRESEARFRQAARIASLGHYVWDEAGSRYLTISEEVAEIFGVPSEEFMQWRQVPPTSPDERERYVSAVAHTRATGEPFDIEYRIVTPDGRLRFVREIGTPVFSDQGELNRIIGVIQDVTGSRHSKQALVAAEHLSNIGSWRWSTERQEIISASEEYARILGISEESLKSPAAILDAVHPEDRERVKSEHLRVEREGRKHEIEYRVLHANGDIRHVLELGESYRDSSGRIIEQFGTLQDVTALKRAELDLADAYAELEERVTTRTAELTATNARLTAEEDALRLSEQKYRDLFDESPISIWEENWSSLKPILEQLLREHGNGLEAFLVDHPEVVNELDASIKVLTVNNRTVKLFQLPDKKTWRDRQVSGAQSEDTQRMFCNALTRVANGELHIVNEYWSEIYTGERIYTRGHLFIPEAHSRTWSRVITSTEDITEYRRAEDANEQLEAQLLHTQKMHTIGQLSGGIAHDFNNLLTTILGFAELLELSKVDDLDGKVSAYVKHIKCAGERGRDLVKQMVTFSQGGPAELKTLELLPVVSESVEMLRATFPASVEIEETYAEDLPKVTAGAVHLQQAIVNLCINARDAMSGQGKLRVKLGYTQQVHASCAGCHRTMSGGYVTLEVADSGCGIPSNIRKRMFDPFFTTKPVGQGPGMGLAVVHGIIHRYGGHILVDSTPNEGTTMTLLLPGAVSASESRSDK